MQLQQQLDLTQLKIIYMHFYQGLSQKEIAFKLDVRISDVRIYVKDYRRHLRARAITNSKFLGKKRLLNEEHIEYLRQEIGNQHDVMLTLGSMKGKLGQRFQQLKNLSKSTISRYLKMSLNLSYKKMSTVGVKMSEKESALKMVR